MATDSENAIVKIIRDHLLTYVPPDASATLNVRLGGRLYHEVAPDDVTFPYAIMRVVNDVVAGDDGAGRKIADVELMLYAIPINNAPALNDAADVADQAMRKFEHRDADGGFIFTRGQRQRSTLPVFPDAEHGEVFGIRIMYPLVLWPKMLTQFLTTSN